MASRTLRRRVRHDDLDGRSNEYINAQTSDSLNEPLLGSYHEDKYSQGYNGKNGQEIWEDKGYNGKNGQEVWDDKDRENIYWAFRFTQLIAQWAQWLGNVIVDSSSFMGKLMTLPFMIHSGQNNRNAPISLSPLQEERLRTLRQRLEVSYDGSRADHQDALKQLWKLAYPGLELPPLKSELWKKMGWQGCDPSTDFRGGGYISLENLIFFAKIYPEPFQRLLLKQEGNRSEWEYPFAVAGINISFMLAQMLDLQSGKPSSLAGKRFLQLLGQEEMAFDDLYCVAFTLMDAQWLAKRASYMEFNDVLKSTRTQLERELALDDVFSVKDLPAYTMLRPK